MCISHGGRTDVFVNIRGEPNSQSKLSIRSIRSIRIRYNEGRRLHAVASIGQSYIGREIGNASEGMFDDPIPKGSEFFWV